MSCDANGKIVNPMSCQYGCQADRCNTCEPNLRYCDGNNAVTCGSDGMPGATTACGAAGCAGGVCNTCTPNATSCEGDKLVVCNANGSVASTTDCLLGCESNRCRAMQPLYGVGVPSGTLPALNVTANGTLDVSACSGTPNTVNLTIGATMTSIVGAPQIVVVNQSGATPICVVRFGSITVASGVTLTIVNSESPGHVVSLQSVGDIQIAGTITFINSARGPTPGTSVSSTVKANMDHAAPGAGGGGGARAGGKGGACTGCSVSTGGAGGAAVTTIMTRLTGGSAGGHVMDKTTVVGTGGQGGGGLQLVSLGKVTIAATGRIAANGQGGTGIGLGKFADLPAGGGGAGGAIVIEAPVINASVGSIVAANGGGGGGGCFTCSGGIPPFCTHHNGQPGQLSANRAAGGDCPGFGDGGFEATGAAAPSADGSPSDTGADQAAGGSGGGSSGFVILRARSAAHVSIAGSAIVSPTPTIGAVNTN